MIWTPSKTKIARLRGFAAVAEAAGRVARSIRAIPQCGQVPAFSNTAVSQSALHGGQTHVDAAGIGIDETTTAAAINAKTANRGLRRNWIMGFLLARRLSRPARAGLEPNRVRKTVPH